jgi:hypothetical protein
VPTRYLHLPAGTAAVLPSLATRDMYHIQAKGSLGVLTIEAATVHRTASNDCHAQAQAVVAH